MRSMSRTMPGIGRELSTSPRASTNPKRGAALRTRAGKALTPAGAQAQPKDAQPLAVLVVEDSDDDAQLDVFALEDAGYRVRARRVDDAASMRDALRAEHWDVVLCDHLMPHFDTFGALEVLGGVEPPLIMVSGAVGEEEAVALIHAGAADYVSKDHLSRLGAAVRLQLRA